MSELVRAALVTIVDGGSLSSDQARAAMGDVMDGEATPAQLSALLMGLRMRGETVDELVGFAAAMRDRVVKVEAPDGAIDVVGTGGDGSGTFNISTTAALVAAAAGIPVAKHGNRAITSKSGAADVLDALGVRIDHDAASAGASLRSTGFAFLFAPVFHPAMRHAGPTRREIGVRTAFNLLGPLTNPAGTGRGVIGVGVPEVAEKVAEVARRLGTERTFVIHGAGVDELPLDGTGVIHDVTQDGIQSRTVSPERTRAAIRPDRATRRRRPGRERPHDRSRPARRTGRPPRCHGPQRGGRLPGRGAGRVARGRGRPGGADHRCRARARATRNAPRGAGRSRGGGSGTGDRGRRWVGRPVTVAPGRDAPAASVVHEIAERRRADVRAEVAATSLADQLDAALASPRPRPVVEALAAPGLHLIAEIKRSSPSAGAIAAADEDIVARARAYEAGGAAVISVLCEPHWFGGSVADLRAVRAAVSVPVLAKEFVVEEIQLPMLRAAGADLVLLLASLHDTETLARLVERALEIGLEPLVEAHDEAEVAAAVASGARIVGLNNRDLRTLEVDPETASRLRELVPDDRLVVAESGVRDPDRIRRWRAQGFDAALVGEAFVRSVDPAATVRSFVAAGRAPDDPANDARRPFVKICGVTDGDGVLAAGRAGADAVGLNLVPGTPRALGLAEAADLARLVRATSPTTRRPRIVAITVDASAAELDAIAAAIDPDAIQFNGSEPVERVAAAGREVWKVLHLPAEAPTDRSRVIDETVSRGRAYLAAGATRLLLDTAGGPHPGGTGVRAAEALAAAVAREVPVTLAGGLGAVNVATALRSIAATGVDVASGVEGPRVADRRPTKDPFRVALFVKRARAARDDRPDVAFGPSPVHPGLLEADAAGRWGMERDFGGRYVPETLMAALEQLETAYDALRHDPAFWAELRELLGTFAGRPTPIYRADRLADAVRAEAARLAAPSSARPKRRTAAAAIPWLRLYLKREDLAHTGAHKINNALGQSLLTRRLGKTRVIAETGAGQHGVATATACALLDLPCVVYMGAEDIDRQQPNVLRMRALGAEVRAVTSGTATLKDAVNEAMRDWVTNVETTHYVLGSAMGPHPYPTIVRDLQRRIGDEAAAQLRAIEGRLPDVAMACVGGGSNAIGLLARFIGEPTVRLAVVEAAGDGMETGRHAAAILGGTPGILHGSRSLMLQDADGQVIEAHSASAGLDYPGIGPQLAALAEGGRIEVASATDREAVAAMRTSTRTEGILPALETAHAIAALPKLLAGDAGSTDPRPDELLVLLGFSGRGDKDLAALERFAEVGPWASAT